MSRTRLAEFIQSCDTGSGDIIVMRPNAGYDLSDLPQDRVVLDTGFWPDYAYWQGRGLRTQAPSNRVGICIVVLPRSKSLARAMIAQAAAQADTVVVDGQKTDGADSMFSACRKIIGDIPCISKAHGRLFWFKGTDAFTDWSDPGPVEITPGFVTRPGVFSQTAIDKGSALLAQALPATLPHRMADLGAGWGYLAASVLRRSGVQTLDLIEAERIALDCARLNIRDDRVRFHWADATQFMPEQRFQGIVMNPPFHTGRRADPALGNAFIRAAAGMLTPEGRLWMVANRHLSYETALSEHFRDVSEFGGDKGFKLLYAARLIRRK